MPDHVARRGDIRLRTRDWFGLMHLVPWICDSPAPRRGRGVIVARRSTWCERIDQRGAKVRQGADSQALLQRQTSSMKSLCGTRRRGAPAPLKIAGGVQPRISRALTSVAKQAFRARAGNVVAMRFVWRSHDLIESAFSDRAAAILAVCSHADHGCGGCSVAWDESPCEGIRRKLSAGRTASDWNRQGA